MYNTDLSWIDNRFPIKSHQVNRIDIFSKTIFIFQICINGIKTLHTGCPRSDDKLLSCSHQFYSGSRNVGMQIFRVIPTGQRDTKQPFRSLANF